MPQKSSILTKNSSRIKNFALVTLGSSPASGVAVMNIDLFKSMQYKF